MTDSPEEQNQTFPIFQEVLNMDPLLLPPSSNQNADTEMLISLILFSSRPRLQLQTTIIRTEIFTYKKQVVPKALRTLLEARRTTCFLTKPPIVKFPTAFLKAQIVWTVFQIGIYMFEEGSNNEPFQVCLLPLCHSYGHF